MKEIPSTVPPLRIAACNQSPVREDGDYVLYWMIAGIRRRSPGTNPLPLSLDVRTGVTTP